MTLMEIINELDLVNFLVETHYEINDVALDTSDLDDGGLHDVLSDMLMDVDDNRQDNPRFYTKLAYAVLDEIGDLVESEILDRDQDAIDASREYESAKRGNY